MLEAPEKVETLYVVQIYKDMQLADEVETSNSFELYVNALDFYNETIKQVENKQFVTLEIEIVKEDARNDIYNLENIRLADNYESENK